MRATSYSEIISGALDNPHKRFETAIIIAHAGLTSLYDEGYITGATIYGSAISHEPGQLPTIDPLSDLDITAVISDDKVHLAERGLHKLCQDIRKNTAVVPEVGCLTRQDAQTGKHSMLPMVLAWLKQQPSLYPEMTIGEAPANTIVPNKDNLITTISTWLGVYRDTLQADRSTDEQVAFSLSIPHIAARKTIDALRWVNADNILAIPAPPTYFYTKAEVATAVYEVYGERDSTIRELYQELELTKQFFCAFVGYVALKNPEVSEDEYEATLNKISEASVPKAYELLQRMDTLFLELADSAGDPKPHDNPADRLIPLTAATLQHQE